MANVDWSEVVNLAQGLANLDQEMIGDWHQDPWGWPEFRYVVTKDRDLAFQHCRSRQSHRADLIDVPKENWGTRPAVVLDIADRLTYQLLVDRLSVDLIGDLSSNAYGWRLPTKEPQAGVYSHNNLQWDNYTGHLRFLGTLHTAALRTDLVSFFNSVPIGRVQEEIESRAPAGSICDRLCHLLEDFQKTPNRAGLPQRSSASAVLANMYLRPLDDVMRDHAPRKEIPLFKITYHGCARWMDDIWIFGDDPAAARRAQMDLQSVTQSLSLHLNYSKTEVFEGDDVAAQVFQIEHSAIDDAIDSNDDFTPLEELIDRLLDDPEKASRTSVRFASKRIRDNSRTYRVDELPGVAQRMPHVADIWFRLFREYFDPGFLAEWYLDYASSDWATHEWSVAYYGRMFSSSVKPSRRIRDYFSSLIRDSNTTLPLLAVAAQRLCSWDPGEGRSACREAYARSRTPHSRRVLALASLEAGEQRSIIRKWVGQDRENYWTLRMLNARNFVPPRSQKDFYG